MNLYQPTITGLLSVSGSINISGSITIEGGGTISGTASIATTALTASSADNFLVRNTLTATTLVVQTVTSSVIYSSGSNVFGNNIANTQVFTGSVSMNPGGLFVSSSGLVGINSINPTERLTVVGAGLFGGTGTGTYSLAILNNDQSNVRFRLTNTGTGGQSFSLVSGNPGVSNSGLAIFDETNSVTRLYVSSSGNVGIGTTSAGLNLSVQGLYGLPATSGAQTVGIFRVQDSSSNISLDMGVVQNVATWMQSGNKANSAVLPLILNPSGGNIGIGTTAPGDIIDVRKNQNAVTYFYFRNTDTTNTNSRAYLELISGNNSLQVKSIHNDNCYLTPTLSTSALYLGVANSMMVTSGGNLQYNITPNAYYHVSTETGKISVANGGTLDFGTFSGMIIVNNHTNGQIGIWLVGAGNTALVSTLGSTSGLGTMAYNGGINGYTWTSNQGSTAFYGFYVVKTRANA